MKLCLVKIIKKYSPFILCSRKVKKFEYKQKSVLTKLQFLGSIFSAEITGQHAHLDFKVSLFSRKELLILAKEISLKMKKTNQQNWAAKFRKILARYIFTSNLCKLLIKFKSYVFNNHNSAFFQSYCEKHKCLKFI